MLIYGPRRTGMGPDSCPWWFFHGVWVTCCLGGAGVEWFHWGQHTGLKSRRGEQPLLANPQAVSTPWGTTAGGGGGSGRGLGGDSRRVGRGGSKWDALGGTCPQGPALVNHTLPLPLSKRTITLT